jgi:hypothetical protein
MKLPEYKWLCYVNSMCYLYKNQASMYVIAHFYCIVFVINDSDNLREKKCVSLQILGSKSFKNI